jgi:ABC-type glycerol-3-phosphate transport system substrate-binding protein
MHIKRLFLILAVAALATAAIAPLAASASSQSISAGRLDKVNTFWCAVAIGSGHGKLDSLDAVRIVRAEYNTTAPASADPELVGWVQGWHASGCGAVANTFVRVRVSSAQYQYYLAVVSYWT